MQNFDQHSGQNPDELLKKAQSLNDDKKHQEVIDLLTDQILDELKNADLFGEKAFAYYKLEKYELSKEAADKALAINPKQVKALHSTGVYFSEKKEYEKAIESYKKAIDIEPKFSQSSNGLGIVYYDQKKPGKAIELFKKAIEIDSKYASPYIGLGSVYYDQKEYGKAIEFYRKAIELDPKLSYSYYNLGNVYHDQKNYDRAIELYKKAIEIDPKFSYSYNGLGNVYSNQKKYDEAIKCYEKSIELNPKFSYPYNGLGSAHFNQKEYYKAIECFEKAIELDPMYSDPYNGLGNLYKNQNNYDKAIECYKKSIELDPKSSYPYNGLGNVYYNQKEYDKAIEYYKKSIELDPKSSYPYNGLGNVYYDQKEYDKAIEFYKEAISIDPKFSSPHNNLGNVYLHQKEYEKAIDYYQKAIEIDLHNIHPYNGLGNVYLDQKKYDKAIEFYKKGIDIDPKYGHLYNGLGNVYYYQKKHDKAIEYYQKAIEVDTRFVNAYYNLGLVYYDKKDYNNTLLNFQLYIDNSKSSVDYPIIFAESQIQNINTLLKSDKKVELDHIRELINKIKNLLEYKDGLVIHYTSLSATKAMVLENSLFRLSEGAFLNDTSEGRELFKFLSYPSFPKQENDTVAEVFAKKPFIGSFVPESKHDDLTLWRMYGKEEKEEARGCAIKVDPQKLIEKIQEKLIPDKKDSSFINLKNEFRFYKVVYCEITDGKPEKFLIPGNTKKNEKKINAYMDDLHKIIFKLESEKETKPYDNQKVMEMLNEIAFLFKNAAYQHEQELRLILSGVGFEKIIDMASLPPRVYIELVSLRPLIEQITLGPKVDRGEEWASALYYSLDKDKAKFSPEIRVSQLPFK